MVIKRRLFDNQLRFLYLLHFLHQILIFDQHSRKLLGLFKLLGEISQSCGVKIKVNFIIRTNGINGIECLQSLRRILFFDFCIQSELVQLYRKIIGQSVVILSLQISGILGQQLLIHFQCLRFFRRFLQITGLFEQFFRSF